MIPLPGREVLATLRHGRVKVAEYVDIDTVLLQFLVSRWNQVDTT
jgi:hypothetical protein